jgi:hypothetical protein
MDGALVGEPLGEYLTLEVKMARLVVVRKLNRGRPTQTSLKPSTEPHLLHSASSFVMADHRRCGKEYDVVSAAKDNNVLLLTPVVPPTPPDGFTSDPFEPLGRALERRGCYIHHVPYTPRGITDNHIGFIKRAAVVLFIISGSPSDNQPSQVKMCEKVWDAKPECAAVVAAYCDVTKLDLPAGFPPVIRLFHDLPDEIAAEQLWEAATKRNDGTTTSCPTYKQVPALQREA